MKAHGSILLVDDEAKIRTLLTKALIEDGNEVVPGSGVRGHHQHLRPLVFVGRGGEVANEIEAGHIRHLQVDDEAFRQVLAQRPEKLLS